MDRLACRFHEAHPWPAETFDAEDLGHCRIDRRAAVWQRSGLCLSRDASAAALGLGRSDPASQTAPLQLATPPAVAADQKVDKGGVKVFGHTILPKLDFGLELLYGEDEPQLQLQQGGPSFDDSQDVTVLGKVKRHF